MKQVKLYSYNTYLIWKNSNRQIKQVPYHTSFFEKSSEKNGENECESSSVDKNQTLDNGSQSFQFLSRKVRNDRFTIRSLNFTAIWIFFDLSFPFRDFISYTQQLIIAFSNLCQITSHSLYVSYISLQCSFLFYFSSNSLNTLFSLAAKFMYSDSSGILLWRR